MGKKPLSPLNFIFFHSFVPWETLSIWGENIVFGSQAVEAGTLDHDVFGIENLWMDADG